MKLKFASTLILLAMGIGCRPQSGEVESALHHTDAFKQYWYAGKAEVNSYHLSQSRYGESREGTAVLIFVTEDFSQRKQVKLDRPEEDEKEKVNVMKLNFTKHFITGIYPYSMMLSAFSPVQTATPAVKATMSSQEWCGQVYTQLNLKGNRYQVKSHSYFEGEADQNFSVKKTLLEDELWNMIRINHEALPSGDIDIIPGLFFTRLNHQKLEARRAKASKIENDSAYVFTLAYAEPVRTLSIEYEKQFPFKILRWKETWIERNKEMQTFAILDKSLYVDYWTKNKNEHQFLRDSLDLD